MSTVNAAPDATTRFVTVAVPTSTLPAYSTAKSEPSSSVLEPIVTVGAGSTAEPV